MKKKIALITGVTGQDGSYLAKFLLKKNYIVHGIKRRSSTINTSRIDDIYEMPSKKKKRFILHHGDMTDSLSLQMVINKILPDEVYNLAAQSHVAVSFQQPEYTASATAIGTLRILDCLKNLKKKVKFYQASTSELFGIAKEFPQSEKTPFYPRSPYGVAKLYAHWITLNYREAYNMFACSGILFNHESPLRGETFVTRKIVNGLVKIKNGTNEKLILGNLNAKRDWGHAKDYVEAMWLMLQQKTPKDYIIATGKQYTIKQFVNMVCKQLKLKINWKGKGIKEKGILNNKVVIECSPKYLRPSEVKSLLGDSSKARKELGWKPKIKISELIKEMIDYEEKKFKEINY